MVFVNRVDLIRLLPVILSYDGVFSCLHAVHDVHLWEKASVCFPMCITVCLDIVYPTETLREDGVCGHVYVSIYNVYVSIYMSSNHAYVELA